MVNDWLKFAETKNATLLVAVSTFYVVIVDNFPSKDPQFFKYYLWFFGSILILISGIVAMSSFIPFLKFSWGESKNINNAAHNLFYFGDIAKYSAFDYIKALYNADITDSQNKKIELDLAGQAIKNSQIAVYKYKIFSAACTLLMFGLICVAISFIL